MGLDISVMLKSDVICPHCGKVVRAETERTEDGGGRGWYPILEKFGYYVSYENRTEETDWYGKDMVLTTEQTKELYEFVKDHHGLYGAAEILSLIAVAMAEGKTVAINADW